MIKDNRRKVYLDIMRIIAAFLVIFNHSPGFQRYQTVSEEWKRWILMFISIFTKINVPLFFMISGSLLLGRTTDFKDLVKRRIKKIVLTLFIFNLGLYIIDFLLALRKAEVYEFSVKQYLLGTISGNIPRSSAYWFLYAYLGFIFLLPFMQKIAQNMKKEDFWMLMALRFASVSLILMTNEILRDLGMSVISMESHFNIPLVTLKAFFYPLIGYYIDTHIDIKKYNRENMLGFSSLAVLGIFISSIFIMLEGSRTGTYTQNFVELFDYIIAIVVFLVVKYFVIVSCKEMFSKKIEDIICTVGSLTFGIYLLDPYLNTVFYGRYQSVFKPILPTLVYSFFWCCLSMLIGGSITLLLKKIPLLKKIL